MNILLYSLAAIGTFCVLIVVGFMIAACYLSKDNDTDAERDSKDIV